ncbi:hypothetical protein PYW08_011043 [Mythimna loreyi]|uniref:Uncharacterized protein n=1 Tax=Mythimna loreyi TaxID=667449 RepID=A0ACC2Q2B3_9NEOP|nr:hypothetical protein PYW08_011043 [Mythimna loreyi]
MDEIFRRMERAGRTDVNNLIQWLKDSKVIETARDEEVRQLFSVAVDETKVELEKFKEVIACLAVQQVKTAEQLSNQLAEAAPKIIDAACVGLLAFKEALAEQTKKCDK